MRKEADDTGPLAELEHWRFLEARFNSFLEQLKLPKEQILNKFVWVCGSHGPDCSINFKQNHQYIFNVIFAPNSIELRLDLNLAFVNNENICWSDKLQINNNK